MKKSILYIIIGILALTSATSCVKYSPKPRGYFRIELKEREYSRSDSTLPYSFEYPKNLSMIIPSKQDKEWFDIVYPRYNARIYFSYKPHSILAFWLARTHKCNLYISSVQLLSRV